MRVPARGWTVDRSREKDGVVRIEARGPARAVTVAWSAADSSRLAEAGGLALLEEIATRVGSPAPIDRAGTRAAAGTYLGRPSLRVEGSRAGAGGAAKDPFVAVLFIDPTLGRTFVIECRASAAGPGSLPVRMWEMEARAATFRVAETGHAPPK